MFRVCKLNLVDSWLFCKCWKYVFQRFSLLSISISNNLADDSMVNSSPLIFNTDLFRFFLEFMIIYWNLSGFTIMSFLFNQFSAVSHSFCKVSESSIKSLLPTFIVLSSAKFASSAYLKAHSKIWDNFWHLKAL